MLRLRRLRAILVLAVASGILWVPLGMTVSLLQPLLAGRRMLRLANLVGQIPMLLLLGCVCGFFFSLVLAAGARKRTFAGLTLLRVSALGAIGASALPLTFFLVNTGRIPVPGIVITIGIYGAVGALTAGSLLAFARRAPEARKLGTPEGAERMDQVGAGTV
jgi:hypothetical protein